MTGHTNKTTVERIGDIVLIGEEHRNKRSAKLAEEVLDGLNPGVIGLEHVAGTGAIGVLRRYADNHGITRVKIDGPKRFRRTVDDVHDLIGTANFFADPIQEDGDLDPEVPQIARNKVRDKFGLDTHRQMYPERERYMARRLNRLRESWDTPVVAGMGAFHVDAVAEMMPRVGAIGSINSRRIRNAPAADASTDNRATG